MKKLTMKDLPKSERPYEKLLNYGEKELSNAELLAVILKNGTKEYTALELANSILILCENGELNNISKLEINELMNIKGIGKVKAIEIKAAIELARRISKPNENINKKITNSNIVYELLKYECINETKEKLFVISLNVKNEILKISKLVYGGQAQINLTMKELFIEPIKIGALGIIIVHNHPSGDTSASKADINFTFKAIEIGKLLGIEVLDHIIISNKGYTSLKENGQI